MDNIYIFLILAGLMIAIFIVILNHQKQKDKVSSILKDAHNAQPMFMQQAVERKLKTLKTALYNDNATIERKRLFIDKLEQLEKSYGEGTITLEAYNDQLQRLISKLSE